MAQRRLDLALLESYELAKLEERLLGVLRVVRENDGSKEESESAAMHLADVRQEMRFREEDTTDLPF